MKKCVNCGAEIEDGENFCKKCGAAIGIGAVALGSGSGVGSGVSTGAAGIGSGTSTGAAGVGSGTSAGAAGIGSGTSAGTAGVGSGTSAGAASIFASLGAGVKTAIIVGAAAVVAAVGIGVGVVVANNNNEATPPPETLATLPSPTPTPTPTPQDTPTPTPDPTPPPEPTPTPLGYEVIEFGGIVWRVLDEQGDKMLVISEGILEVRNFRANPWTIPDANSWASSDIRTYLNVEFYDSTFSDVEKQKIAVTELTDVETTDKIFLLSYSEADAYFDRASARVALDHEGETSWWWLRSAAAHEGYHSTNYYVFAVGHEGGILTNILVSMNYGVRPAMWILFE